MPEAGAATYVFSAHKLPNHICGPCILVLGSNFLPFYQRSIDVLITVRISPSKDRFDDDLCVFPG